MSHVSVTGNKMDSGKYKYQPKQIMQKLDAMLSKLLEGTPPPAPLVTTMNNLKQDIAVWEGKIKRAYQAWKDEQAGGVGGNGGGGGGGTNPVVGNLLNLNTPPLAPSTVFGGECGDDVDDEDKEGLNMNMTMNMRLRVGMSP